MKDGKVSTKTNHNGGINGGITNGMPVRFTTMIKPTPSIFLAQETVDLQTGEDASLQIHGRHDPAIIHRARVVLDSAAAIVLLDLLIERFGPEWVAEPKKEAFSWQNMELIGKTLAHSFSKPIHEQLGGYSYELLPMEPEQLDRFLTEKKFRAVNVTIPYKETVIPYCDELDEHAAAIGAVNTIVNENGRLIGHNTDFAGMMALVRAVGAHVQGAHVLILGSGGTCKTASAVMRSLGAASITVASRSNKPGTISYEQAQSLSLISDYCECLAGRNVSQQFSRKFFAFSL